MPAPKLISLDSAPSQWDLERQRIQAERDAIAQATAFRAANPRRGELVSGHFVGPSWTQHLSDAVGAYLGRKDLQKLDKDALKVNADERKSLAEEVQSYIGLLQGRPDTPGPIVERPGKLVDPPAFWKPEQAQTFGLGNAPTGQGLNLDLSTGDQLPRGDDLGAALAGEFGQSNLPPGTDFSQFTQPPFLPPAAGGLGAPAPASPPLPDFAPPPAPVQEQLPGIPGTPADPQAALIGALSSQHPLLRQLAAQQLQTLFTPNTNAQQGPGVQEFLKAAAYLDPASLTAIGAPESFKQLRMRNDLMTIGQGEALVQKTSPEAGQPQILPTTEGRFGKPFQRGGDWYQRDNATGMERKLDNAAKVSLGIQNFEPAFGKAQADLVSGRIKDLQGLADSARKDNRVLNQATEFLNSQAKTGVLVEPRNYLDKLAVLSGFKSDTPGISNTDLFVRTMRERAGAILSSGAYGSGTGISEKDLDEVVKIASGKDMTEAGLRTFIKVAKHYNGLVLRDFDSKVKAVGGMPGAVPGFADFMSVPLDAQPISPAVGGQPTGKSQPLSPAEDAELRRLLQKAR